MNYNLNNFLGLKQDAGQLSLYADYYQTRPINQYFHKSVLFMAGLAYSRFNNFVTDFIADDPTFSPFINFAYRWSYHPVSRTSLPITGGIQSNYQLRSAPFKNAVIVEPQTRLDFNYFINFQTRLIAGLNVNYSYNSERSQTRFLIPDHEIYGNQLNLVFREQIESLFNTSNLNGISIIGNVRLLHSFY